MRSTPTGPLPTGSLVLTFNRPTLPEVCVVYQKFLVRTFVPAISAIQLFVLWLMIGLLPWRPSETTSRHQLASALSLGVPDVSPRTAWRTQSTPHSYNRSIPSLLETAISSTFVDNMPWLKVTGPLFSFRTSAGIAFMVRTDEILNGKTRRAICLVQCES